MSAQYPGQPIILPYLSAATPLDRLNPGGYPPPTSQGKLSPISTLATNPLLTIKMIQLSHRTPETPVLNDAKKMKQNFFGQHRHDPNPKRSQRCNKKRLPGTMPRQPPFILS